MSRLRPPGLQSKVDIVLILSSELPHTEWIMDLYIYISNSTCTIDVYLCYTYYYIYIGCVDLRSQCCASSYYPNSWCDSLAVRISGFGLGYELGGDYQQLLKVGQISLSTLVTVHKSRAYITVNVNPSPKYLIWPFRSPLLSFVQVV